MDTGTSSSQCCGVSPAPSTLGGALALVTADTTVIEARAAVMYADARYGIVATISRDATGRTAFFSPEEPAINRYATGVHDPSGFSESSSFSIDSDDPATIGLSRRTGGIFAPTLFAANSPGALLSRYALLTEYVAQNRIITRVDRTDDFMHNRVRVKSGRTHYGTWHATPDFFVASQVGCGPDETPYFNLLSGASLPIVTGTPGGVLADGPTAFFPGSPMPRYLIGEL